MTPPDLFAGNSVQRACAVVCDRTYFPGLRALINSIHAYHGTELALFVFDHGLTKEQLDFVGTHPLSARIFSTAVLPFSPAGTWEAKQQIPAWLIPIAQCVYLLDADLVLTSRVDDVFLLAEEGWIVSSTDGAEFSYGQQYGRYNSKLPGRQENYFNTGALCMNVRQHWDLAGLWSFSSQFGEYSSNHGFPLSLPGHGDQGLFNAIAHTLGKTPRFHVLPEEEWCDSTKNCTLRIAGREADGRLMIINETTGSVQRLAHCSGQKWWTERGEFQQRTFGDKYEVFRHFETLDDTGALLPVPCCTAVPL